MLQTLRGEGTSRDQIVWVMVEQMGKQATGEKQGRKPWTLREFGGQTVWDWLHLLSALAIPVVLAAAGLWFTAQQDQRQQRIEDDRAQQAQNIESQRAKAERELAKERAQDEALQAYLDQMSNLLLEKDLRESKEDSEVRTLARARTLTVLGRLDSERNGYILQFLREAKLINGTESVVTLSSSDLSGADLRSVELSEIDLSDADLHKADLTWAELSRANLSGAELYKTDLINASLSHANFSRAYMGSADLFGADLNKANLSVTDMYATSLTWAELSRANLSGAHMIKADLSHATLSDANLSHATLGQADLHKA